MRKNHTRLFLALLLACPGCAATAIPDHVADNPRQAVIVAKRPVLNLRATTGSDMSELMSALGRPGGQLPQGAMEFIVRTPEGRLVSIVQPAESGLQSGRAVTIQPGPQARLTPG